MLKVFWDLDGTLVDNRYRLYELFCVLTETDFLTFDEYWSYKFRGYGQGKMLELIKYDKKNHSEFQRIWLKEIEKEEWLKKDILQKDAKETLEVLFWSGISQYVITNRQFIRNVEEELKWLNIPHFFNGISTTALKGKKADEMRKSFDVSGNDFMIGDSAEDIMAAKELGIHSIAICTDVRNEKLLKKYEPEWLLYDRQMIPKILNCDME